MRIKIQQTSIDIFLNQIFWELTDCVDLDYLNAEKDAKRYSAKKYYLPKGMVKNYNVITNGCNSDTILI